MKFYIKGFAAAVLLTLGFSVMAEDASSRCNTRLVGIQETSPILTSGSGSFSSWLDQTGTILTYTLTYTNLSSNATMAHIHFGHPNATGAPVVFLCGGGGKPACPASGGVVIGTIIAADVLGVPAQGVTAGDFKAFRNIVRNGKAYVNVHSTNFPAGEIRGQMSNNCC